MREIKFRAWDRKVKVMRVWEPKKQWLEALGNPFNETDYKAMQFTGLLDRNGKEIYEADIYETPYGNKGMVRFVVRWNHGAFGLVRFGRNSDNPVRLGSRINRGEGQVIGDIYSTPELLTA